MSYGRPRENLEPLTPSRLPRPRRGMFKVAAVVFGVMVSEWVTVMVARSLGLG